MASQVALNHEPPRPVIVPPINSEVTGEIPRELQDALTAPLPAEAITSNDRNPHLSSIKPAFIIERMNQVFGIGGYIERYREISMTSKTVTVKKGTPQERDVLLFVATVHGTLDIPKYGVHLENFGGSENENAGDELKGACTDAFTKMCSHLGIGLEVYKGKHDGQAESSLPDCPQCGKRLRKSKDDDSYFCWKAKGGCGANFNEQGLKSAQERKAAPQANGSPTAKKPASSAPVPQSPLPTPDKITIQGVATGLTMDANKTLWLKLGDRACATKLPDIQQRLARVEGRTVELLVSVLKGRNGDIHQIHKVVSVDWKGGRS